MATTSITPPGPSPTGGRCGNDMGESGSARLRGTRGSLDRSWLSQCYQPLFANLRCIAEYSDAPVSAIWTFAPLPARTFIITTLSAVVVPLPPPATTATSHLRCGRYVWRSLEGNEEPITGSSCKFMHCCINHPGKNSSNLLIGEPWRRFTLDQYHSRA